MTPFKFLTYLLLGATTVTAVGIWIPSPSPITNRSLLTRFTSDPTFQESFAVEPSRPHRLKRRSFEDCVKAMVADVWAGPTRPPNARTAVCYSGHFRIRDMNVYVFDFDSNRECVEKQGLIKEKNR